MMKGETDIEFMRCDQEKEISPEEKKVLTPLPLEQERQQPVPPD